MTICERQEAAIATEIVIIRDGVLVMVSEEMPIRLPVLSGTDIPAAHHHFRRSRQGHRGR